MSDVQERLNQIALLADDWDAAGAPAPTAESIKNARKIAEVFEAFGLTVYKVAASVEGGVGFTCKNGENRIYLECDNGNEIWIARYKNGAAAAWRFGGTPPEYEDDDKPHPG